MAKLSDPLSFRFVKKRKKEAGIPVESMNYPDLDDRFPSGNLDSVTKRDKFGVSRRRYSKRLGSTIEKKGDAHRGSV